MPGRDKNFHWKTKRLFLDLSKFNFVGTAGADTGQANGGPVIAAAGGGSELAVAQVGAAGDEFVTMIPIPWDMNRDKKVLGRVWFIHSATDADTPDWVIKSKFVAKQATVVDTDTSEDKATAIAAAAVSTTAESLEITAWTDLSWESYIAATDLAVQILVEANGLGSASANEIEFIGFELMYEIEATEEVGGKTAAAVGANPL